MTDVANMRRCAFTLVELLIVVIILGILAAVVVPRFSDAGEESKASALEANLHIIRSQLELYAMQHKGAYPDDYETFPAQMTDVTDVDGHAAVVNGVDQFGPYLASIPNNPYTGGNKICDPPSQDFSCDWLYTTAGGAADFRSVDY